MGQFFKQLFASVIGTIVGLTLFFLLGASGFVLLLISATSSEVEPKIKNKSVLVFDLSTQINDTEPPSTFSEVVAGEKNQILPLRQVLHAIEQATTDTRIVGIFLDGS